jgi:predicted metal-binding protein
MKKALETQLIKKAESLPGVEKAAIMDASTIVIAEWVLQKCKFGCSGYGACLTCPPHSPPPEKTAEMLKSYKKALLLHAHEYRKVRRATRKMELEAFLSGLPRAFGMSAGPCDLCKTCALEEGCRHPDEARPSLEACGVDVFTTVQNNGFPIRVLTSTDQTPDYYSIVLLE